MNIEYIYYFTEAARSGSISRAAQNYNISQQGLSRAIQRLEAEYGIVLFERKGNSISLTKAGEVFFDEAEALIAAHNHLREQIARFMPRKSWEKRFEALITLNVAFNIWPILGATLTMPFPEDLLIIKELRHDQIVSELSLFPSGNSFALMSIPEIYGSTFAASPLEFEALIDMELMARVGKASKWAQRECVSIDDINKAPLVLHDDPVLDRMLQCLTEGTDGILDNVILRSNNPVIQADGIRRFNAIGFSNSFCFHYDQCPDFKILPLEKTVSTPIFFVYNKTVENLPELFSIRDSLKASLADNFPSVVCS